jgi:DNA polymerase (family 10)
MLDKLEVARALREIGLYLNLKGDNKFRARAYETGARALEELRVDLGQLIDEQRLTGVPGIGPALAATIAELWSTGRSAQLERLRAEIPRGALELAEVLSFARIQKLTAALGIANVAELKEACSAGRLREVKGFGAKTEQSILKAIEKWENREQRVLLVDALEIAEPLRAYLAAHPAVHAVELAGSLRRWKETVADLDLLVASDDAAAVRAHFLAFPSLTKTVAEAPEELRARLASGLCVDLYLTDHAHLAPALVRATGSVNHVQQLETLLHNNKHGFTEPATDEAEVYRRAGLPLIPPELREGDGELAAALAGTLPLDLITLDAVRGMTHCHTVYSDGKATIEEMAREAEAMGMQYLTITDHSPAAHYANGVQLDRLKRQWDEIARVQESVQVHLLRGTESDILEDGALDYPDQVLEQLDVVIASIHSRMKMDAAQMTARLTNAMRRPLFKIWGHALGRLVLRRDPFDCDVERVLDVIAESPAAIEINGDPYRLDLAPEWVKKARQRGIKFVISTDAHSTRALHNLRFGVHMARRGWVRRGEVLNALSVADFKRAVQPAASDRRA